jgi:hypothetical protein
MRSAASTIGTKTSSHNSGLCRISLSKGFMGWPALLGSNWNDYRNQILARLGEIGKLSPDTVKGYMTLGPRL